MEACIYLGMEFYEYSTARTTVFQKSQTNINFDISEEGHVSIIVYNLQGRVVAELVNEFKGIGSYDVVWNANNLPSSVYFVKMDVNSFTATQKVMLVK